MIKAERYQRDRVKKLAFWEPHLRFWQGSGSSVKQYCKENNLNASTFTYWRYIVLGKPQSKALSLSKPSITPLFLEVKTQREASPTRPQTSLRIETPRGIKIVMESENLERDLAILHRLSE
jgi:hypothetical protein